MEKSFEILLNEHREMMLSYASALLGGDSHEAEDVVQEASVTAYRKLDDFDVSRNFARWLRGIVRNKVLENRRYAQRRPLVLDPDVISGVDDVYSLFDRSKGDQSWLDRVDILKQCVAKLKEPMRVVIERFYGVGFSLGEIAGQLGLNAMTVGQRLSRSRKLIRECVDGRIRGEGL